MDRLAWKIAALVGTLLALTVVIAPAGIDAWLRVGLLGATLAGIAVGTMRYRQHHVAAWWLLGGAVAVFALASAWRIAGTDGGFVDGTVLAGYLLLAWAAVALTRRVRVSSDRDSLLDGAIVGAAVAAVLAVLLFEPALLEGGGPSPVHLLVGPVTFAAIAGIVTRFALLMPQRCTSAWLIVAATGGGLGGNLLRTGSVALGDGFHTGSLPDALLLVGYVCLAVAALHPSMTMLGDPPVTPQPARIRLRLVLLGVALLVPPAILALDPPAPGGHLAIAAAAVINVLALWRIARLFMQRERAYDEVHAQSRRDPLTGLPNRLELAERMHEALGRARRAGAGLAILFCDLDDYKDVNDRYGHRFGDAVLVEVAQRLRNEVRGGDVVARVSGDEFVVVAEGADAHEAGQLAARLVDAVSQPMVIGDRTAPVSISIGIAAGDGMAHPDDLIHAADLAMYEEKRRHPSHAAAAPARPA